MKTVHAAWISLLALMAPVQGCGLGTEIGNGFKEEGGDGKKDAAKQNDKTMNEGGEGAAGDEDQLEPESTADKGPGTAGGDDGAYDPQYTFDFDLIAAPCASPFGDDLESPIRLAEHRENGEEGNIVKATRDDDQSPWQLGGEDDGLIRSITPFETADMRVSATDAEGGASGIGYQCMGATQVTNNVNVNGLPNTYRRVQVSITKGSLANVVTWYTEGTGPYRLVRVTIDDVDGETDPLILDAD